MREVEEPPRAQTGSHGRRALAWGCLGLTIALILGSTVIVVTRSPQTLDLTGFVIAVGFLAFSAVGAVVTRRAPGNPVGPLLLAVGTIGTLCVFGANSWARATPPLPGAAWAALLSEGGSLWIAPLTLVLFRFPDGRPLSRRWRAIERFTLAAFVLAAVTGILSPEFTDFDLPNPIGVDAFETTWLAGVAFFVWIATMAGTAAAAASFIVRYRRSSGVERARLKWLALAAGTIGVGFFLIFLSFALFEEGVDQSLVAGLFALPFIAGLFFFPIAAGIGILRHRLFDIDLVISKALVFGLLAGFIVVVYAGVVLGVGWLAGSVGDPVLSALAAAAVALAFQPVRRRAHVVANRLVYGERASPYEVLSGFSDRLADAYSVEDVLPRMARILAEGTGGSRVRVWLRTAAELRDTARWPTESAESPPVADVDDLPDRAFEVRHQGEPLGAITVAMPPDEPMTPAQERLVTDVASQAGLVLRNAALISDLRSSRQRLVAAQDEERRRIERNIHDGAQQQLVALSVKQRLVEGLLERDPEKARRMISEIQAETIEALENLRDLARGIYPPLLADQGLAAALEAQGRKSPVPVIVEAKDVGRYPQEVEAAVYFSVLEALQNVAKYAGASVARVGLADRDSELVFTVTDDGRGFDRTSTRSGTGLQGVADRLAAIGGELIVRSSIGSGTSIEGRLPRGRRPVPASTEERPTDANARWPIAAETGLSG